MFKMSQFDTINTIINFDKSIGNGSQLGGGSSTSINITETSTNAVFYPTFVSASGTGQTLRADTAVSGFSYNPNTSAIIVGTTLKLDGTNTGRVAVGYLAGATSQGQSSVAIGNQAGNSSQGQQSVAIGLSSGTNTQGQNSVAVGNASGNFAQSQNCVAVGFNAGNGDQRANCVAVGSGAGQSNQGTNSIAIGYLAGSTNQIANSICLNASGTALNTTQTGLFVNPVRGESSLTRALQYNTTTSEITYTSSDQVVDINDSDYFFDSPTKLQLLINGVIMSSRTLSSRKDIVFPSAIVMSDVFGKNSVVRVSLIQPQGGDVYQIIGSALDEVLICDDINRYNPTFICAHRNYNMTIQNISDNGIQRCYISMTSLGLVP